MNLSTKAKNLILLKKLNLVNSKIPIFLKYSVEELKLSQNTIIKNIKLVNFIFYHLISIYNLLILLFSDKLI